MKTWNKAELEELMIGETAQGGKDFTKIDLNFYDENGNAYSSYEGESTNTPDQLS